MHGPLGDSQIIRWGPGTSCVILARIAASATKGLNPRISGECIKRKFSCNSICYTLRLASSQVRSTFFLTPLCDVFIDTFIIVTPFFQLARPATKWSIHTRNFGASKRFGGYSSQAVPA